MVMALPVAERQKWNVGFITLEITIGLAHYWNKITNKFFDTDDNNYSKQLRNANRNGTLKVVQEIIYDKERKNG